MVVVRQTFSRKVIDQTLMRAHHRGIDRFESKEKVWRKRSVQPAGVSMKQLRPSPGDSQRRGHLVQQVGLVFFQWTFMCHGFRPWHQGDGDVRLPLICIRHAGNTAGRTARTTARFAVPWKAGTKLLEHSMRRNQVDAPETFMQDAASRV